MLFKGHFNVDSSEKGNTKDILSKICQEVKQVLTCDFTSKVLEM